MDVPEPGEAPQPVCKPPGGTGEADMCLSDQEDAGTLLQVCSLLPCLKYCTCILLDGFLK